MKKPHLQGAFRRYQVEDPEMVLLSAVEQGWLDPQYRPLLGAVVFVVVVRQAWPHCLTKRLPEKWYRWLLVNGWPFVRNFWGPSYVHRPWAMANYSQKEFHDCCHRFLKERMRSSVNPPLSATDA